MKKAYYISGEWNLCCDVCSKKIKANEARQRWDGFIVCPDDFENRHSQDFVKAQSDKITVPFVRPIPEYVFIVVPYNFYWDTGYTISGYIDQDDK